jgi:hypothetical protein
MSKRRITLDDLPPALRAQAEAQIGTSGSVAAAIADTETAADAETAHALAVAGQKRRRTNKQREMSETERMFAQWWHDKDRAFINSDYPFDALIYEGITLRLAGGSRYTPDFLIASWCRPTREWFDVRLVEVKGTYRLHSHGRALTAWREARAQFPMFRFRWYMRTKDGFEERYTDDSAALAAPGILPRTTTTFAAGTTPAVKQHT